MEYETSTSKLNQLDYQGRLTLHLYTSALTYSLYLFDEAITFQTCSNT